MSGMGIQMGNSRAVRLGLPPFWAQLSWLRSRWLAALLFVSPVMAQPGAFVTDTAYHPHLDSMLKYTYVREIVGRSNRGPEIDRFNRMAGNPLGAPYCAGTITAMLIVSGADVPTVRTGLARKFYTRESLSAAEVAIRKTYLPPGTIGIMERPGTIFGHAYLTRFGQYGASGATVEANTSSGMRGSQRDGDGIYERRRMYTQSGSLRMKGFTFVKYRARHALQSSLPCP